MEHLLFNEEDPGRTLLALARGSLVEAFGGARVRVPEEGWLAQPGACFVTLTAGGILRGCVGTLEPHRPLGEDAVVNARSAAFRDPRFPPLRADELAGTRIEVTLLSPVEPLPAMNEAEAIAALRPGVDGVVLLAGRRRGVFIPRVWEELRAPEDFLAHLKEKAGLPRAGWPPETRLSRFTARRWEESP